MTTAHLSVDPAELQQILSDLVSIPSVNPSMGESEGEGAIADYVAARLRQAGLSVRLLQHAGTRASVVATLDSGRPGPTLMLNGHVDTVPAGNMTEPFLPRLEGHRLYGRGAYDMKGGVAACIAAAATLASSNIPFRGRLQVSAVADEEVGSLGTRSVLAEEVPSAVIVAEPTGLVPGLAHRGFLWLEVETRGVAAHGSRPDLGIDANLAMGRVLEEIRAILAQLGAGPAQTLAGLGSMHVGRLQGGGAWSIYADRCVLGLERRTVPGETGEGILAELETRLKAIASAEPTFHAEARVILERPPFLGRGDGHLHTALQRAGAPPATGVAFWTDAALFAEAGAEVVVFGASGEGAHADIEWVDVESVRSLSNTLIEVALDYLGAP